MRCPFWPLLESDPRRLDISSDSYESPVKAQILRDAVDSEGKKKEWRTVTGIRAGGARSQSGERDIRFRSRILSISRTPRGENETEKAGSQKQSIRFASTNRAANSQNQPVIRTKLTVPSSLAAIQIELTIVMHWKSVGRWREGRNSFDFRLDPKGQRPRRNDHLRRIITSFRGLVQIPGTSFASSPRRPGALSRRCAEPRSISSR